jgi:hypothetical protein
VPLTPALCRTFWIFYRQSGGNGFSATTAVHTIATRRSGAGGLATPGSPFPACNARSFLQGRIPALRLRPRNIEWMSRKWIKKQVKHETRLFLILITTSILFPHEIQTFIRPYSYRTQCVRYSLWLWRLRQQ